jgi:hypothetical protein
MAMRTQLFRPQNCTYRGNNFERFTSKYEFDPQILSTTKGIDSTSAFNVKTNFPKKGKTKKTRIGEPELVLLAAFLT